jgi:transposase
MRRQVPDLVEFGCQNELTEIVMSTSTLIAMPAAQDERATLLVGFELSKTTWLIGLYSPDLGKTVSRYKIDGGDLGKTLELIAAMRRRLEKLGKPVRVVSIYEAGYDGFWLHRALRAAGVDNRVIDAASVPVDRRARRVKTDRLDLEQLIRMLLALERGETRACRVVRVPKPAEEDAKRQHRERQVLVAERTGHGNRITGLLMALGIRGVNPRRRDFVAHLQTLRTGDGEPLPPHTKQALTREHERLCLIERQIREIEATQAAEIKAEMTARQPEAGGAEGGVGRAALLMRLKGLGQIGAVVLSREVFYRHFDNRREVASYFGLTPSPYNSGGMRSDQGIGKAGNPRARTLAIELAWLWVRHQPESALTHWFLERVGTATGRIRRIAIVALARKLMIALWRYLTTGMIPEGAVMKPA